MTVAKKTVAKGACGEENRREKTGQEAGREGKDGPLLLQVIAAAARGGSRRRPQ